MTPSDLTRLDAQLQRLHLHYIQSHYQALATKAAEQQRSHLDYLEQLVEGEATMRENRSIERRIKNAAPVAGWGTNGVACLGPPQYAVERDHAVSRGHGRRRYAGGHACHRGRCHGVGVP